MMTPSLRYRDFANSDVLVICRECSGRLGYTRVVHRDRVAQHDAWHDDHEHDSERGYVREKNLEDTG